MRGRAVRLQAREHGVHRWILLGLRTSRPSPSLSLPAACTWDPSLKRRRTAPRCGKRLCQTSLATGSPPATSPVS